jgi:hypothetical protein
MVGLLEVGGVQLREQAGDELALGGVVGVDPQHLVQPVDLALEFRPRLGLHTGVCPQVQRRQRHLDIAQCGVRLRANRVGRWIGGAGQLGGAHPQRVCQGLQHPPVVHRLFITFDLPQVPVGDPSQLRRRPQRQLPPAPDLPQPVADPLIHRVPPS